MKSVRVKSSKFPRHQLKVRNNRGVVCSIRLADFLSSPGLFLEKHFTSDERCYITDWDMLMYIYHSLDNKADLAINWVKAWVATRQLMESHQAVQASDQMLEIVINPGPVELELATNVVYD